MWTEGDRRCAEWAKCHTPSPKQGRGSSRGGERSTNQRPMRPGHHTGSRSECKRAVETRRIENVNIQQPVITEDHTHVSDTS